MPRSTAFGLDVPVERREIPGSLALAFKSLPPAIRHRAGANTPAYDAWLRAGRAAIRAQTRGRISCRVAVTIRLEDCHPGRDAADTIAAVMELLVAARVLAGDAARHVRAVAVEWAPITGIAVTIARQP